jgi:hypothetical protein
MEAKINKSVKPQGDINYNHKATIHLENIGKEKIFESKNLKCEFTFSPYTCK